MTAQPLKRLLVLGGSWFLGRTVVAEALRRGYLVTTFRRGLSGPDLSGVDRLVRGDRAVCADLERLATYGPWDLVVDTSGYAPQESGLIARVLEPVVQRFVFVSSVSAYSDWPLKPLTEQSELLSCPSDADGTYGYDGNPSPSVYGFTKAGCEKAVREVFGSHRTTILRPGVILGPWEYVGRLPWWLRRMQRGGRVLAPGSPDRTIQPVDVRDVASFAISGPAGTFNLTGNRVTMETFLLSCRAATESNAELQWITDEKWLIEQNVSQWTEIPLWRTYRGAWQVSSAAALGAGFGPRPISVTVSDTWQWLNSADSAVSHERSSEHGISPEKESAILGTWDARERDHCG